MAIEQTSRLEARLPASVYATLKRAAELKGRSLSDFVVRSAPPMTRHSAPLRRSASSVCLLRIKGALLKPSSSHRLRTLP